MNKKFTYIALLVFFLGATAFIVLRYTTKIKNKVTAFYPLKDRKGALAQTAEWKTTKEKGEKLIRIVRETPGDKKSALALASLYIQEGRTTGDYTYYDEAALKYIDNVLSTEPTNFDAIILKSLVQLSQHHFAEGLQTAEKAKSINPYNSYVYGLIVDGNVEMGNYAAAVENSDTMVSIRPDLRSYSRIAYLREIHGDMKGAVEAMKMAVEAGFPGEESTEWARIQLGHLYENTGDLTSAEMHYTIALDRRPDYAYAIAGLGNIAIANKDYKKAISLYLRADTLQQDYAFKEKLAEAYTLNGQTEKADATLNVIIADLTKASESGEASMNHHMDKELAYIYLMKKEYGKALKHALAEYNRRPKNIDVAETVAWVYYKMGETEKALPYLTSALKTGSKSPVLLCRAALIYAKAGDKAKAKNLLQEGLKARPNIAPELQQESRLAINTL
ncbi:MAG TPA: tetratricopeptide repeat protein [Flavisolibacter sp.]|nr:tetratricopeptide repeat protein [Flavisolibacter sp.]